MLGSNANIRVADLPEADDRENAYNQFQDDFARASMSEREEMVQQEPASSGDAEFDAKVAAAVEALCHRARLTAPAWVSDTRFFLDKPVWAMSTISARNKSLRDYLRETTPSEFARRNLYYGPNVLKRC